MPLNKQVFDPANVMLSDSLGKEVKHTGFTKQFLNELVARSALIRLGEKVDMGDQRIKKFSDGIGELSDAYFVGEGRKIGTAKVTGKTYTIEAKKIAVILPVTEEFLSYSWANYFSEVVPLIADKFNKMIDGAAFLGLHDNPFGNSVYAAAQTAGKVTNGQLTADKIIDIESATKTQPNAFVGNRVLHRQLRKLNATIAPQAGQVETVGFVQPKSPTDNGSLDGLPYVQLQLAEGQTYPSGRLLTGNFNGLKYGIPNGTSLKLTVSGEATLSTVQNTVDSGDVSLFEQDMKALRAVFEIGVAVPDGSQFAVLEADNAI